MRTFLIREKVVIDRLVRAESMIVVCDMPLNLNTAVIVSRETVSIQDEEDK